MADIELVIKVPKELYEQCKETELTKENEGFAFHIIKTVANGSQLTEERLTMSERLKLVKNTRNRVLEKVEEKIDFEEKWLLAVFSDNGRILLKDVEIAISGIRSVIADMKGEQKCEITEKN